MNVELKSTPGRSSYAFIDFEDPKDAEEAVKGKDGYFLFYYFIFFFFPLFPFFYISDFFFFFFFFFFFPLFPFFYISDFFFWNNNNRFNFEGESLKVELASEKGLVSRDSYSRRERKTPSKRTDYRVIVSNLPSSGSWQDLKDHMRRAGDVCFSDVLKHKNGIGIVEFLHHDDMKYAVPFLFFFSI